MMMHRNNTSEKKKEKEKKLSKKYTMYILNKRVYSIEEQKKERLKEGGE